jgi:hypothetical protein
MKKFVLSVIFVSISVLTFAQRIASEGAYCNGSIAIAFMIKADQNFDRGAIWVFSPGERTVFSYTVSNGTFTFTPVRGGYLAPGYLASNGDLVIKASQNEVRYPFSPHTIAGTYTNPKGDLKYIFKQTLDSNSKEGQVVKDIGLGQFNQTGTYDPRRHVLAIGDETFFLFVVYGNNTLFEVVSNTIYSRTD